jgi:hypothetical protein
MTLRELIRKYRLRMESELTDRNPHMEDDEWARRATHWKCVIKRGRAKMTVFFSQGPAIVHEPSLEEVLDSLGSDAAGYLNARGFEDWAAEYGYDPDSRRAEAIWKAVGKQIADLRRLLGDSALEELAFKTERL